MKRKVLSWLLFLGLLLVLLANSTRFVRFADALFWPVRLGVLLGFSALLVWATWRRRGPEHAETKPGWAEPFLSSAVRWYHGDTKR